ncbi:MAG: ImmA/IrrE family metallo-endopeptidase [Proteobacteria bacterium]|nr:ImmA/IrrE family metallo-endopeptidase [Pseudomonadota bacterium]
MSKQSFREAKPCHASKATIESFAADFASKVGYRSGAALEAVVAQLGGKIIYQTLADLSRSPEASIRVFGNGKFEIYLPDYTNAERDRFSIAHEIGHYILHYPLANQPMTAARFGSTRVEWEANWFAAGFLMPEAAFRKEFARHPKNIAGVARHFRVSTAAATARAKALGLL